LGCPCLQRNHRFSRGAVEDDFTSRRFKPAWLWRNGRANRQEANPAVAAAVNRGSANEACSCFDLEAIRLDDSGDDIRQRLRRKHGF